MALGRKTGGRQAGAKNRTTLERNRVLRNAAEIVARSGLEAFAGDALCLMVSIYKNPSLPLDLRLDAAKVAVRYERPPLAPVAAPAAPEELEVKAQKLHLLLAEMRETVGSGKIERLAA